VIDEQKFVDDIPIGPCKTRFLASCLVGYPKSGVPDPDFDAYRYFYYRGYKNNCRNNTLKGEHNGFHDGADPTRENDTLLLLETERLLPSNYA
jgi:hypothetical protein